MPLMFSLAQHSALDAVISRLEEGERLFAFPNDLYVLCGPGQVAEAHSILEEELWRHPNTNPPRQDEICNKGGFATVGWEDLQAGTRMMDPNAIVWRGKDIPSTKQGLNALLATLISPRISSASCQTAMKFCWAASRW